MDKLALIVAACFWAGWHLLAKICARTMTPTAMMFVFACTSAILAPVFWVLMGKDKTLPLPGVGWAALAYCFTAAATLAYSYALTKMEVSNALLFTSGYPIVVLLLAVPLLGESLTWTKCLGMCLVVAGVMVGGR
jgi:drug/metabolite transporter (DMT)-like permease